MGSAKTFMIGMVAQDNNLNKYQTNTRTDSETDRQTDKDE